MEAPTPLQRAAPPSGILIMHLWPIHVVWAVQMFFPLGHITQTVLLLNNTDRIRQMLNPASREQVQPVLQNCVLNISIYLHALLKHILAERRGKCEKPIRAKEEEKHTANSLSLKWHISTKTKLERALVMCASPSRAGEDEWSSWGSSSQRILRRQDVCRWQDWN